MKKEHTTTQTSLLFRILCSIAWVLITCWLGAIHLSIVMIASYTLPIIGLAIWGIVCIIAYWILLWWTGRAYATWYSWRLGLIFQFFLVALSLLYAYFIGEDRLGLIRPLTLLIPYAADEENSMRSFIASYLIAFAEITAWQALAICLRHFYDKQKERKQKTPS